MSSSRPSTTVTGSTADCRWKSPLPRAKAVGLKISSKDIPLSLLCLTFGPLLYGALLGTVAAILILPFVSLIVSHHDVPIVARSIGAFCEGRATSGLDACVRGLVAGLADHKPSALHRLEIWRFVAEHIEHRPISGWGLDPARRLSGGTSQVIIHNCDAGDRPDGIELSSQTLPLNSHNAILQVWLELGGIGVALSFGPSIFAIPRAFRRPAWRTRADPSEIAGTTAAAVSIGLLSFGIWQEWFLSGLFIAVAFVVLAARQSAAARGALPPGAK